MKKNIALAALVLLLIPSLMFAQRSTAPKNFTLTVVTNPAGAEVYVDGNPIKGNQTVVPAGNHTITVRMKGYYDFQQAVNVGSDMTVSATLQPLSFALSVNANIKGAEVYINNGRAGNTPFSGSFQPGTYSVRVSAPGYFDFNTSVNLNGNTNVDALLQPISYVLSVTANVNGAEVYINNGRAGNAPYSGSFQPGTYGIRVSAPGYLDFNTSVNLNGNQTVNAQLQPATASVVVNIPASILNPGTKDVLSMVKIFVDGNLQMGNTFQVTGGTHEIRLTSGGFSIATTYNFQPGRSYTIEPSMALTIR